MVPKFFRKPQRLFTVRRFSSWRVETFPKRSKRAGTPRARRRTRLPRPRRQRAPGDGRNGWRAGCRPTSIAHWNWWMLQGPYPRW